jgi:hypothetical protein
MLVFASGLRQLRMCLLHITETYRTRLEEEVDRFEGATRSCVHKDGRAVGVVLVRSVCPLGEQSLEVGNVARFRRGKEAQVEVFVGHGGVESSSLIISTIEFKHVYIVSTCDVGTPRGGVPDANFWLIDFQYVGF